MRVKACLLLLVFLLTAIASFATASDTIASPPTPAITKKNIADQAKSLDNYLHYGFHLGTDLALSSKWLSPRDRSRSHISGFFGFYVRGGYKYIFGELGFDYSFHKCFYEAWTLDEMAIGCETVESRYLQVPMKVVGNIEFDKRCALLPSVGVIYKPLIHWTKNDIFYGKSNLMRHQWLLTAGAELRIKYFTVGLAYRTQLRPYFSDRKSIKQQYLGIIVGVQF